MAKLTLRRRRGSFGRGPHEVARFTRTLVDGIREEYVLRSDNVLLHNRFYRVETPYQSRACSTGWTVVRRNVNPVDITARLKRYGFVPK